MGVKYIKIDNVGKVIGVYNTSVADTIEVTVSLDYTGPRVDNTTVEAYFINGKVTHTVVSLPVPPPQPAHVPTTQELKELGKPYTLNGVDYQVPLNETTQNGVVAVTVQKISGMFTSTVFSFSNGVKMPITNAEWDAFAVWFGMERSKFFV